MPCYYYAILAGFALAGTLVLGSISDVHAQTTFTVNYTGDDSDTNAGNGSCDTGVDPPGPATVGCSLRAALEEANALAGTDTIRFTIPTMVNPDCGSIADGICTISPSTFLPTITETLFLDGRSQQGASCGTGIASHDLRIVLDGSGSSGPNGLYLDGADGSVIRGMVVQNFGSYGVRVSNTPDARIYCNFVGTSQDGMSAAANGLAGIYVEGSLSDRVIIGTNGDGVNDAAEGNLVSGNDLYGVQFLNAGEDGVVAGNYIGVAADGTTGLGNANDGIFLTGDNFTIGTNGDGASDEFEFNVIGANGDNGIVINSTSTTKVAGNFIGTDSTGTLDLGNTNDGVYSSDQTGTTIGHDLSTPANADTEQNVIAFNGGNGVSIVGAAQGTRISSNVIFSNDGLGIDLGDDGLTINDAGDSDPGENKLQNYPDVVSAVLTDSGLMIAYFVDSDDTNSAYPITVEFFETDADQQEGRRFVGSTTYESTDWNGCGAAPCGVLVTITSDLVAGDSLLATATDNGGNTSEFSAAVEVVEEEGVLVVNSTGDLGDEFPGNGVCDNGGLLPVRCTLRAAIEEANARVGADSILFEINPVPVFTDCDEGTGICTIAPDSALPIISETLGIFGTSQTGASCGTSFTGRSLKIVLDGSSAGSNADGLSLSSGASGSFITGLNIQGFDRDGIHTTSINDVHVACNNIGTNVAGTAAAANGRYGVLTTSSPSCSGTVIGTNGDGFADAAEWNIIGGNGNDGVQVFCSESVIAGNLIGLGSDGSAVGNGDVGIFTHAAQIRVGTNGDGVSDLDETNFIVANGGAGISVESTQSDIVIAGNYIGTTAGLVTGLGNTSHGISFPTNYKDAVVGTNLDGVGDSDEGNTIAYNGGAGIAVTTGSPRAIRGNSIFSNVGLGIDLNNDGATANDADDIDGGPNKTQNYPDIALAAVDTGNLSVTYTVDSDPANSDYPVVVEFFRADADHEEGRLFVARDTFSVADWSGCGTSPCDVTRDFGGVGIAVGDTLVATATDSLGNTSEFSLPTEVVVPPPPLAGITLYVKAFLEGSYSGGAMSTALQDNAYVPLSQPFSDASYNGTTLDYDSTQTVGALPDSTVDWVLVSLRTGTGPETEVAGSQFAALVSENGTVASTGEDSLRFIGIAGGSYYLVVRGRNHADVMSSSAIDASGGTGSWDFTTGSGQAFGSSPMKDLGDGSFGMYAGDADADGFITATDFNIWNTSTTAGDTGLQRGDFDMDGNVTATDFNLWNANTTAGGASGVPD